MVKGDKGYLITAAMSVGVGLFLTSVSIARLISFFDISVIIPIVLGLILIVFGILEINKYNSGLKSKKYHRFQFDWFDIWLYVCAAVGIVLILFVHFLPSSIIPISSLLETYCISEYLCINPQSTLEILAALITIIAFLIYSRRKKS